MDVFARILGHLEQGSDSSELKKWNEVRVFFELLAVQ